jgi:hypothetical protein
MNSRRRMGIEHGKTQWIVESEKQYCRQDALSIRAGIYSKSLAILQKAKIM